jgi:tetratricopeptide (TPR) repeat protein
MTKEPPDLRRLNPAIGSDLRVVVATALEKDRDRRYQTALDLAEDLRRVRLHEPIAAKPVGPLVRLQRWAQRNPGLAVAVGGIFAALAAGLVVSLILYASAEAQRVRADGNAKLAAANAEAAERNAVTAGENARSAEANLIIAKDNANLAESRRLEAERSADLAAKREHVARAQAERARAIQEFLEELLKAATVKTTSRANLTVREVAIRAGDRIASSFASQPDVRLALHQLMADVLGSLEAFPEAMAQARLAKAEAEALPETNKDDRIMILLTMGEIVARWHVRFGPIPPETILEGIAALEAAAALAAAPPEWAAERTRGIQGSLAFLKSVHQPGPDLLPDAFVSYVANVWGEKDVGVARAKLTEKIRACSEAWEKGQKEEAMGMLRKEFEPFLGTPFMRRMALIFTVRMADAALDKGLFNFAEPVFRFSIELGEAIRPPDPHEVANLKSNLAILLYRTKRYEEAIAILEVAIPAIEESKGKGSAGTLSVKSRLAHCYLAVKSSDKALALLVPAVWTAEAEPVRAYPEIAGARRACCRAAFERGRFEEALVHATKSLEALDSSTTKYPESTRTALMYQAQCLTKLGRMTEAVDKTVETWQHLKADPKRTPDEEQGVLATAKTVFALAGREFSREILDGAAASRPTETRATESRR